jgi:hypothetical protein
MDLEKARKHGGNYYLKYVEHAKTLLPQGTPEKTVRQVTWLYIQYGCNTYTDGPGFAFKPEDVRDALRLTKHEGMALAKRMEDWGILKMNPLGRYYFPSRWM